MNRLRSEMPRRMQDRLASLFDAYRQQRLEAGNKQLDSSGEVATAGGKESDAGGLDTFFAWFFRGEGPADVVSGANIQRRFIQSGTTLATFFSDNYVADVLRCNPAYVESKLAEVLGLDRGRLLTVLRKESVMFLGAAK